MQPENFIPLDKFKPYYVPDGLIEGRVISVSSKEEPRIGVIKGFSVHENSGSKMPIVEFEDDGKQYLCFSLLVPYTKAMWHLLAKKTKEANVAVIRDILHLNAELRRLERPDVLKDV